MTELPEAPPAGEIDLARLPSADRLRLAYELLESVVTEPMLDPFTSDQMVEINRRVADIDSGRVLCEPGDAVRERWAKQR